MQQLLPIKDKSEGYKYIKAAAFDKTKRKTSPHKHNQYLEIVYLSKGSGWHYINSHKYKVIPPVMYFVKKEQTHHWELTGEPEGFVIILKKDFFARSQDKELRALFMKINKHDCLNIPDASTIQKLMELLVKENENMESENGFLIAEGLLKSFFAKAIGISCPAAPGYRAPRTVNPVELKPCSNGVNASEKISNAVSCASCTTSACLVKQHCSGDWLRQIDLHKYQTVYKQGEYIFRTGSPVFGIYFIRNGKAKVVASGPDSKEQIVRLASDGHILGHKGEENDFYPISAVAMEDSLICFVENKVLCAMFTENPKFIDSVMMFYSRELRKMENRMKNIAQMNLREKTAEALLYLHGSFGLNKTNEINVPFSRKDIAGIAGSTRQQITMQLHDFEKERLIKKRGKKIALLNVEALRKIIA